MELEEPPPRDPLNPLLYQRNYNPWSQLLYHSALGAVIGFTLVLLYVAASTAPQPPALDTRLSDTPIQGCRLHVDCVPVRQLV